MSTLLRKGAMQILAVLAILAAAGVLAVLSHTVSGAQVYTLVAAVLGGTAVVGGIALNLNSPSTVFPHLFVVLAIIGLTIAMALEHIFTSGEVSGIFGMIIGGGAIGAGSSAVSAKLTALGRASTPPNPMGPPAAPAAPVSPPSAS